MKCKSAQQVYYDRIFGQSYPPPIWFAAHFLEKAMASHSSTLAWKNPMDGGAWWAAVHGVAKSRTGLSNFPFTFHFHALEKEMATDSSVLAWRIPGTGVPGGLPSMGSHRIGTRLKWLSSSSSSIASSGGPCFCDTIPPCCFALCLCIAFTFY